MTVLEIVVVCVVAAINTAIYSYFSIRMTELKRDKEHAEALNEDLVKFIDEVWQIIYPGTNDWQYRDQVIWSVKDKIDKLTEWKKKAKELLTEIKKHYTEALGHMERDQINELLTGKDGEE